MKILKYSVFIFLMGSVFNSLPAQEPPQLQSINEGSISDQFEFVIRKSTNWTDEKGQAYEVIKSNLLLELKAHTVDSLQAIQSKLDDTNKTIATQQKEINQLKADLVTIEESLASTLEEKESMVFMGKQMSKSGYSTLVWTIIITLLVFLLLFIYKFKNSNVVTQDAKSALAEIEDEFKEHRRVALEREQKVRRQLQDQINKYQS